MAHQSGIQGVIQVSLLGQFSIELLDQVVRRLQEHSEFQCNFTIQEDVLTRGSYEANGSIREEDTLRVRGTTIQGKTEWSLVALARPLPSRDNPDVLIRNISSTPVTDGNAGALAVALGYSERKFAFQRKGQMFTSAGGLTTVQIYQIHSPPESTEPLDSNYYILEIFALTALKPQAASGATPMQSLRDNAIHRAMELKKVLKGLVDLARVE